MNVVSIILLDGEKWFIYCYLHYAAGSVIGQGVEVLNILGIDQVYLH